VVRTESRLGQVSKRDRRDLATVALVQSLRAEFHRRSVCPPRPTSADSARGETATGEKDISHTRIYAARPAIAAPRWLAMVIACISLLPLVGIWLANGDAVDSLRAPGGAAARATASAHRALTEAARGQISA
jgi:hypothetical protein